MSIVGRGEHPEWLLGGACFEHGKRTGRAGRRLLHLARRWLCWLRVTNEGASAMEFDSADELFTGQVLTAGDMLSMEELQQKPELMLELSESDKALVAAFDLHERR